MMVGVSDIINNSGDGGASGGSMDETGRSGNRWPKQETMALIKIRSDMDFVFRDSSPKAPLWEQVSRKMAELGFKRSAKKCKEKFENVYKYHKRTKDGRSSKADGKSYRFFQQLDALDQSPPPLSFAPPPSHPPTTTPPNANNLPMPPHVQFPSISPIPLNVVPPNTATTPKLQPQPLSYSTSSSTSSDEDVRRKRGKKRKMKDLFEKMMKDVIQKQEEMQAKFLDTLEKRERDRIQREESWKMQEMARMNQEHEFLVQERSVAAAKDAAVIAFLQKVSQQHSLQISNGNDVIASPPQAAMQNIHQTLIQTKIPTPPPPSLPLPPAPTQPTLPPSTPPPPTVTQTKTLNVSKTDNGVSSSRWPKSEIEALINLRTSLELKYQDNALKGPLWEEISTSMAKLGYNRNSKRCKEKWENINKYYKKVKESSKKRPDDSKTCPYFHQLEAIYKDKAKNPMGHPIVQPQQQWQSQDVAMQDQHSDEDDEEEEEEGGYEVVANKGEPVVTNVV